MGWEKETKLSQTYSERSGVMSRFLLEVIIFVNNIGTDMNEWKQHSVNKWKEVKAEPESTKYLFRLLVFVFFSTFDSSLHRHVYKSFEMMCRGYSSRTKCKHLSPKLRTRTNCMFQRTLHTILELFER